MGAEQRDYWRAGGGGEGLFRRVLRRVFGDGEDPLNWALPLYTAWGIRVRVHLVYVLWVLAEVISSIVRSNFGWPYVLMSMGALFALVLLHEYGHCFAARMLGGTADHILMWPLGGLAYCAPPHTWKASLLTTLAGPGVNAALFPILGAAVWAVAGIDRVVFNPFDPWSAVGSLAPYWKVFLWMVYYMNAALLAFNMLVPMYPMDCGRVVHALLWRKGSEREATRIVVNLGLAVAVVMMVAGLTTRQNYLVGLALFGGITCWMEKRRLQFTEEEGFAGYDFSRGYAGMPREDAEEQSRRADREREKRSKQAADEQAELDRILEKIARTGMASLSRREKAWLTRATERRRSG